jgi:hypothetical protein
VGREKGSNVNHAKFVLLPIALALVLVSGTVAAQEPNYNLIDGGVWNLNPDGASSEDGWFLGGGFEVKSRKARFHIGAEIGKLGSSNAWELGGGWHGLLGKRADLVASGRWVDLDVEDGFKVSIGVRWMVLRRLELNGFLNYANLDFSNTASAELNGIWDFARRWGVGGGYLQGDDRAAARVFLRFNFGKRE